MYDNLNKSNMRKIEKVIKSGDNCSVNWIDMTGKFDNVSAGGWNSKTVYFPVALPSICKDDRILFLDADILVTGNLEELYNKDLNGYYLAGTTDIGMQTVFNNNELINSQTEGNIPVKDYYKKIFNYEKYTDFEKYINGGIVLLNLDAIRKDNIEQKMYDMFEKIDFAYNEQDCYNFVCKNKIKTFTPDEAILILQKNIINSLPEDLRDKYLENYDENKKHLIVHLINKPWKRPEENIPYTKLYNQIQAQTPYRFHRSRQQIVRFKLGKKAKYLVLFGHTIFNFT